MPFKSEAQRRYLWANEPEIARDWTDTYGSKIHAANGGIMRLANGGRIGFFQAGLARGDSISPGTSTGGGMRQGDETKGQHIQDQIKAQISMLGAPPGMTTSTGHTPKGPKGLIERGLDFYNKYGVIPTAIRSFKNLKSNLFRDQPPPDHPEYNITATLGNNFTPDNKGEGIIPMALPLYNDYYAQNLYDDGVEDEVVEDNFVQRFRLADPYRQQPGTIDTPVRYT